MNLRNRPIFRVLLPLLTYLLILYASSRTGAALERIDLKIPDSILHFLEYCLLSLSLQPLLRNRRFSLVITLSLVALLAGMDEGLQSLVPGRHCSIRDGSMDLLGGATGWLLVRWWKKSPPAS